MNVEMRNPATQTPGDPSTQHLERRIPQDTCARTRAHTQTRARTQVNGMQTHITSQRDWGVHVVVREGVVA